MDFPARRSLSGFRKSLRSHHWAWTIPTPTLAPATAQSDCGQCSCRRATEKWLDEEGQYKYSGLRTFSRHDLRWTADMWQRVRDETAKPSESRLETNPTAGEAQVERLQRENEQLRRQANYFARLVGAENHAMPEILHLSESLRLVVTDFNALLESANEQWERDERRQQDGPQRPMRAVAAYTDDIVPSRGNPTRT